MEHAIIQVLPYEEFSGEIDSNLVFLLTLLVNTMRDALPEYLANQLLVKGTHWLR